MTDVHDGFTRSVERFVERPGPTPAMFVHGFEGHGSQRGWSFAEAASPRFFVIESFHYLGRDGVLLSSGERFNAL